MDARAPGSVALHSSPASCITGDESDESDAMPPRSRELATVFDAISALLSRCPDGDDAVLRPLMRVVIAEAQRAEVPAETLLRLLKDGWRTLPEQATTAARLQRAESLSRVVTLCIREYYRSDGAW